MVPPVAQPEILNGGGRQTIRIFKLETKSTQLSSHLHVLLMSSDGERTSNIEGLK